jgi:hypothetical protein
MEYYTLSFEAQSGLQLAAIEAGVLLQVNAMVVYFHVFWGHFRIEDARFFHIIAHGHDPVPPDVL